jgi:hypothetical protein
MEKFRFNSTSLGREVSSPVTSSTTPGTTKLCPRPSGMGAVDGSTHYRGGNRSPLLRAVFSGVDFLQGLSHRGMDLGLGRIRAFLASMGNPQNQGTNALPPPTAFPYSPAISLPPSLYLRSEDNSRHGNQRQGQCVRLPHGHLALYRRDSRSSA